MMDKALGLEPAVRRRKTDNASETSSKREENNPPNMSPARTNLRKLHQEESVSKSEEKDNSANVTEAPVRAPPRIATSRTEPKPSDDEQIPSPAIRNIKMSKLKKPQNEGMRSSTRLFDPESLKVVEVEIVQKPSGMSQGSMIKIAVFLLISFFLMYNAMTPSRKCEYKKKR